MDLISPNDPILEHTRLKRLKAKSDEMTQRRLQILKTSLECFRTNAFILIFNCGSIFQFKFPINLPSPSPVTFSSYTKTQEGASHAIYHLTTLCATYFNGNLVKLITVT